MSAKFLNVRRKRYIPKVLISAIFRGKSAKAAGFISKFTPDQGIYVLQGLSFIVLGILLRAIAVGADLHR